MYKQIDRVNEEEKLLLSLLHAHDDQEFQAVVKQSGRDLCLKAAQKWRVRACQHAYNGNEQDALQIAEMIHTVSQYLADDAILASCNWTYGNIYTILDRGPKALSYYQLAADYYHTSDDKLNLARLQVGVVGVLTRLGSYEKARHLAQQIWSILAASQSMADGQRLAGLANNLGIAYSYLGRYEEAIDLYEQKIALWQSWPDHPKRSAEIARTHVNLGVLKKRLNLWAEAERDLLAGQQALARLNSSDAYKLDLARAEMHLAHLQVCLKSPPTQVTEAFARARQVAINTIGLLSLELFEAEWLVKSAETPSEDMLAHLLHLQGRCQEVGSPREVIRVKLLLASYYVMQGELDTAVFIYISACEAAQSSNDWEVIYRSWHGLGTIYVKTNKLESARQAFETAVTLVEQIKEEMLSSDLRSGFLEDKLVVYRCLIALHLSQNNLRETFYWIERSRAQELVRILNQTHTSNSEIGSAVPVPAAAAAPLIPDHTPIEIASLSEVCAALPPDTLMLIYTMSENKLVVLPLTTQGCLPPCHLSNMPTPEAATQNLMWLHQLSRYPTSLIEQHTQMLIAAAQQPLAMWYDSFLTPLQPLLDHYQRLVIVPDGTLFRLPFHAFYDSHHQRYLVETHEISYAASATAWLLGGHHPAQGEGGVAIAYAGQQLHHTQTEIEAIRAVYPEFTVYAEDEATTQCLQDTEVSQVNFVHIASHAVFRADNPLFSYVSLANGRLETKHILDLKLKARLIVLSACETGRGLLRGGEYLGLTYAFLWAGARSIIATHWPVDDTATAQFMGHFYQALADGLSPSAALRQAQLNALSTPTCSYRHPYYWAPFFLIGAENIQPPSVTT